MSRYSRTPVLPADLVEAEKLFNEGNLEHLKNFATQNLNVLYLFALNKQYEMIKAVKDAYIANAPQLDVTIFERLYFNDNPQRDIIKAVAPSCPEVALKIFARLVFPNKYPRGYFERVSKTAPADPEMEKFLIPYVAHHLPHLIEQCAGAVVGPIEHQQHWDENLWNTIRELDLDSARKAVDLGVYVPNVYNFGLGLQKAILYVDYPSIDVLFPVSTHNFLKQSLNEWGEDLGYILLDEEVPCVNQGIKDAWEYALALHQKNQILQAMGKHVIEKKPHIKKTKL